MTGTEKPPLSSDSPLHIRRGESFFRTDFIKDALKDVNAPFATKVQDDGSWQLISAKCGLIPESFSAIGSIYSSSPVVCVENNGSFGVIDVNGKYIVPCDGTYTDQ